MITIQGLDYTVELIPPGLHSNFVGQTLPDELRIMVSAAIAEQKQEEVLTHEIAHMLVQQEPMVTNQPHEEFEGFVSRLSTLIYETLVVNDLLVDGWFDKLVDKRSEEENVMNLTNVNVVERNDNNRNDRHPDESVRSDGDEGALFSRGQGRVGRYSQTSRHQRSRGS